MLNSIRPFNDRRYAATSWTSALVMCRSSARGWTVMPGTPASTHTLTASSTDGTVPPRELRTVATLLTLTESFVAVLRFYTWATRCCLTASAISSAHAEISRWSCPSIMMRSSGSVPE